MRIKDDIKLLAYYRKVNHTVNWDVVNCEDLLLIVAQPLILELYMSICGVVQPTQSAK